MFKCLCVLHGILTTLVIWTCYGTNHQVVKGHLVIFLLLGLRYPLNWRL